MPRVLEGRCQQAGELGKCCQQLWGSWQQLGELGEHRHRVDDDGLLLVSHGFFQTREEI